MKVAIVHDVLLAYGGAERVLESLLEIYPDADLYTFFCNSSDRKLVEVFSKRITKTSRIQKVFWCPRNESFFSFLKPLALLYFRLLNLSKYDVIISSSGSYNAKFVHVNRNSLHVCYLHSPPKYLYEEKNQLDFIKKFPFNILFFPVIKTLKLIDLKAGTLPDLLITNSNEVRERVRKYYKRDATVIYPPVKIRGRLKRDKSSYFVFHSRLVRHKGAELVIKTATKYKLPLAVIGTGYLENHLKTIAGETVKFLGFVEDERLSSIYSNTIALIYAAVDEDFGIVPVEAMSYGIPVIAYRSGGVRETVIDGKTGVFFDEFTSDSMIKAIRGFESIQLSSNNCIKQASKFSDSIFEMKIKKLVGLSLKNYKA